MSEIICNRLIYAVVIAKNMSYLISISAVIDITIIRSVGKIGIAWLSIICSLIAVMKVHKLVVSIFSCDRRQRQILLILNIPTK